MKIDSGTVQAICCPFVPALYTADQSLALNAWNRSQTGRANLRLPAIAHLAMLLVAHTDQVPLHIMQPV
jgi:hypothetical protein